MLNAALLVLIANSPADFDVLKDRRGDLTSGQTLAELPKPKYLPLGFDPTKAEYFDRVKKELKLTKGDLDIFEKHGMVVVDHDRRYSLGSSYYAIYARELPVLITTDSVLHALHKSFDAILMQIETTHLAPEMERILGGAHERVKKGDEDVDLYLTVARNLLAGAGDDLKVPSKLGQDDAAQAILDKIGDGKMETPDTGGKTVLYGAPRMVDWTQFRPRGHYTKTEALKRYFRAMMWLGRADTGFEIVEHPRQLDASIRLVELLRDSDGLGKLEKVDEIISFLVGDSDNLNAFELADAVAKTKDHKKLLAMLAKSSKQKIRSQVVVSNPHDTIEVPPPALFQLFGQRFVIDSFVLSKVVFDSILYKNKKVRRMMPSGLDVMGALGNDEAVRLLAPEMMRLPYGKNLLAARDYVDAQPSAFWSQNVYNGWLASLRTLDDRPQGKHFPRVMQSEVWARKQLQAQLGSWAELRHDTVLYAKQSYTAFPSCEYPTGYVEPYPAFYAAVGSLAREAARRIRLASYPTRDRHAAYFEKLDQTMQRLEKIAKAELAAEELSSADEEWLKKTIDIRGGGSGPPRYDGWYVTMFYGGGTDASEWDPVVVDVHTDTKSQQVLQVGVGDAQFVVVAIDNEDDRTVYVGPVFTYYEFTHPASDRLTDEKWVQKWFKDDVPPRPFWTTPFTGPKIKRHAGR